MTSPDGNYLYIDSTGSSDSKVVRLRLSDHHLETVAETKTLRQVNDEYTGTWVGVAPDGSILMTRDIGSQEVYALNIRWP